MDLEQLKFEIDSIKTDLKKFNGNPFPAIIEAWYNKVEILLKHQDLFESEFVNELIKFKLKCHEIDPKKKTDIGKHKERIQELIEKTFEKNLIKNTIENKKEKLIKSVQNAIDSVYFCGFEKGELIFRGQTNWNWPITPSLFRKYPKLNFASMYEAVTIGSLFLNIKSPFVHSSDPIELLMTAQHFSQPTRLLDWTNDILVGLFFACYDPNNEQKDLNGRLTMAEKSFFQILKMNTIEQEEYKKPIVPEKIEEYKKRVNLMDIHVLEPIIKNPRMRVQDGCFMFFPWKANETDDDLLTLNRYIKVQREFVDSHNATSDEKYSYIFIAHKDIDKNYKKAILQELDIKYGISKETLFIDSKFSKETERHFETLKKHAEFKTEQLAKK